MSGAAYEGSLKITPQWWGRVTFYIMTVLAGVAKHVTAYFAKVTEYA